MAPDARPRHRRPGGSSCLAAATTLKDAADALPPASPSLLPSKADGGSPPAPDGGGGTPPTADCGGGDDDDCVGAHPWRTVDFAALPPWMRDNEYLTRYYRPQIQSRRQLLATGFFLFPHNETFNIWSHALGFLLFVGLAIYTATVVTAEQSVVAAWRAHTAAAAATAAAGGGAGGGGHPTAASAAAFAAARGRVAASAASAVATARAHVPALVRPPAAGGADDLFVALRHAPAAVAAALTAAGGGAPAASAAAAGAASAAAAGAAAGDLGAVLGGAAAAADLRPALSRLLAEARFYGFAPMLLGACLCMLSSTSYHVWWNYSPTALKLLSRVDYCAIAVLCAAHSLSGVFFGFYCSPPHAATTAPYTVGVLAATAATVVAIMHPRFDSPAFRTTRAVTFSTLGGICFAPLAHMGAVSGWNHPEFVAEASWLAAVALAYLAGAVLFASRFPECCAPRGRHDLWGASHQLMHVCVIGAAGLHWWACVRAFRYRMVYGCAFSPFVWT